MNYFSFILLGICLAISGCKDSNQAGKHSDSNLAIKVGTITGPETELIEVVKKVAKKSYGLNIQIVEFTDYNTPNIALNDRSIDANAFQHAPYLAETIKKTGFKLIAIGKTIIYPMGAYSKKIKTISTLPDKAIIAIPNDPANQGRALLLLESAHLIQLKETVDAPPTPADILKNPHQFIIKPMDAALLTRILPDVDLAVINTTFSSSVGLLPQRDALLVEGPDTPYANLIVVRTEDKDKPQFEQLLKAFQSQEVEEAATKIFHGQAIPAWKP